jgi:lipid II:glycine glycyltransferase (peptidoglycan interpeptide bridge formation enzyme)
MIRCETLEELQSRYPRPEPGFERPPPITIRKKVSTGRVATITVRPPSPNHKNPHTQARYDTFRTDVKRKKKIKPLSPNHKFALGTQPIQRRSQSPIREKIVAIYRHFSPKQKNYKSIQPRWHMS